MKTFLRWAGGVILLISAISLVSSSIIAALLFFIAAIILIPPVMNFIEAKGGFKIHPNLKLLIVIGCFIVANGISFNNLVEYGEAGVKEKELADSVAFANLPKFQQDSILREKAVKDSIILVAKAQEKRDEKVKTAFSAYDGSHRTLERFIKKNMNDPDSYDHIETSYWDRGDHLVVLTKFRGANAFGGKVISSIKAKVDLNGNILEIME